MLVKEVQNNNHNNVVNFGARIAKSKKLPQGVIFTLKNDVAKQLVAVVSGVNDVFASLKKIELQKNNDEAQLALMEISEKFGIKKIHKTNSDGIMFANGEKNLIVSTHGPEGIRLRDVDAKTGEVENSLFISGKRYVKTDTRKDVPMSLQYWREDEFNVKKFSLEFQKRLDDIDFSVLKLRKELAKPEYAKFIEKANGSEISSLVNKAMLVEPVKVQPEPAQPKKKLLSYYEKLLLQRAEHAVQHKKPSIDFYGVRKEVPDDVEISSKELYLPPVVKKQIVKVEDSVSNSKQNESVKSKANHTGGRVKAKLSAGFLSEDKKAKVDDLVSAFEELNKNFAGFKNRSTLTRIKNDYPNIEVAHIGRNNLILTDVSEKYSRVEMNILKLADQKDRFLVIFARDTEGNINKVAINIDDGSVLKKLNNKLAQNKENHGTRGVSTIEYFSQDELKNYDTSDLIEPSILAVKNFNSYVVKRMNYLNESKRFSNVGKVKNENANIVADVASLFSAIREKLMTLPNSVTRTRLKYENGMLLKDENAQTSFRGLRFNGGGADIIESAVNVKAYGSSGDVLCVKNIKADGSVESYYVNVSRGTVFDHEPKFATPQRKSAQNSSYVKEHHAPMSQAKIDENDFVGALSPLKKLMSEYLDSITLRIDDFFANKELKKSGRPKKNNVQKSNDELNVVKKRGRPKKVKTPEVNDELKVVKKRGRPKKVKPEVKHQEKINVQAEVARFLMNGLKEIGDNLKTLQKQLNKMQKELQKIMNSQNG